MALALGRNRSGTKEAALRDTKSNWKQLRQAVESSQVESVGSRLAEVERAQRIHDLTLPEMLVGSGAFG